MAIPKSTITQPIPTLGTEPLPGTTPERRLESCRVVLLLLVLLMLLIMLLILLLLSCVLNESLLCILVQYHLHIHVTLCHGHLEWRRPRRHHLLLLTSVNRNLVLWVHTVHTIRHRHRCPCWVCPHLHICCRTAAQG